MVIYNVTRGSLRLLGKSLPRHSTLEVDVGLLTGTNLQNLRAMELYGSIHCTPSLLPKVTEPVALKIVEPQEPKPEKASPSWTEQLVPRANRRIKGVR
jgi:hypothetical protein